MGCSRTRMCVAPVGRLISWRENNILTVRNVVRQGRSPMGCSRTRMCVAPVGRLISWRENNMCTVNNVGGEHVHVPLHPRGRKTVVGYALATREDSHSGRGPKDKTLGRSSSAGSLSREKVRGMMSGVWIVVNRRNRGR
jgi:hypothetical protein